MRLPLPGDFWCPPLSLRHALLVPSLAPPSFPTRNRLDPPINRSPLRRLRPPQSVHPLLLANLQPSTVRRRSIDGFQCYD